MEFRDHNGVVRRLAAFTSKAATTELGRNIVRLVAYAQATGEQTDPALETWVAQLPQDIRDKFVEIGLIGSHRAAVAKPLAEHLEDWQKALAAKGNTGRHVELVVSRAKRVITECEFRF